MTLAVTPEVLAARSKWRYRGTRRPEFALTPASGQESVWDYPRPPALKPDTRRVIVRVSGRLVADSGRAVRVLETASPPTFYVPIADVDLELLRVNGGTTHCEWKGLAASHDVAGVADAAWIYVETYSEYAAMRDHFAFYPSKLECTVDGELVQPQPGGYYGGWVTAELVGPFKSGDAKTAWW